MFVFVCSFLNDTVYDIPHWSEGSDKADPYSADGHGPDERARERPWDAAGPPVQLGPVLCQHPRTETHLARQHGPSTSQKWRSLGGIFALCHMFAFNLYCFCYAAVCQQDRQVLVGVVWPLQNQTFYNTAGRCFCASTLTQRDILSTGKYFLHPHNFIEALRTPGSALGGKKLNCAKLLDQEPQVK